MRDCVLRWGWGWEGDLCVVDLGEKVWPGRGAPFRILSWDVVLGFGVLRGKVGKVR